MADWTFASEDAEDAYGYILRKSTDYDWYLIFECMSEEVYDRVLAKLTDKSDWRNDGADTTPIPALAAQCIFDSAHCIEKSESLWHAYEMGTGNVWYVY